MAYLAVHDSMLAIDYDFARRRYHKGWGQGRRHLPCV